MSPTEDLSQVPTMDLIDRLADPSKPHVTIDTPEGPAVFQFSSSSSPGSPIAKEIERRNGVTVTSDVESDLNFIRFRIAVALDQLRPGDVESIRREIAARAALQAELAASPPARIEPEYAGNC